MRTVTAVFIVLLAVGPVMADWADEERERRQQVMDRHLLRVQQERFEARARGDDPRVLRHLDREFKRTEARRRALRTEIEAEQ